MTTNDRDQKRFWSKTVIEPDSGCIAWAGFIQRNGYGRFYLNGSMQMAHRVAFEWAKGSIPDGLVLDHLCRNRACVNPDHLEAVTSGENTRRGLLGFGLQDRCRSGRHPLTDIYVKKDGRSLCRACQTEYNKARWKAQKEVA